MIFGIDRIYTGKMLEQGGIQYEDYPEFKPGERIVTLRLSSLMKMIKEGIDVGERNGIVANVAEDVLEEFPTRLRTEINGEQVRYIYQGMFLGGGDTRRLFVEYDTKERISEEFMEQVIEIIEDE